MHLVANDMQHGACWCGRGHNSLNVALSNAIFVLGSNSAEIKLLPTFFQSSLLELQTLAHSLRGIIRELAGVEDLTIPVA